MTDLNYDVILSHGPSCNDGRVAAWIIWRQLPEEIKLSLSRFSGVYSENKTNRHVPNSETTITSALEMQKTLPVVFVFIKHNTEIPNRMLRDKNVLILDLNMSEHIERIVKISKHVTIIDHHFTTQQELMYKNYDKKKCTVCINTSPNESAATLVWKYFNPTFQIPEFLEIVRMGDTWSWEYDKIPYCKDVLNALYVEKMFSNFYTIENLYRNWNYVKNMLIDVGVFYTKYQNVMIKNVASNCNICNIYTNENKKYTVAYVQSDILISDIGANIRFYATKKFNVTVHFTAVWKYVSAYGYVTVSLRDALENINLSKVAKTIKGAEDGGGHKNSASFYFHGLENFHKIFINFETDSGTKHTNSLGILSETIR